MVIVEKGLTQYSQLNRGYSLYLTVTDFINQIVQVLKEDLYWFRISTQEAELLEPTESGNKG